MNNNTYIWVCILILFVTVYFTRMLPFLFCKGEIKNKFINSLLSYLPYAVLTSMIFPEVFLIKGMDTVSAVTGFIVAMILAYKNKSLITVLAFATIASYVMMLLNPYISKWLGA